MRYNRDGDGRPLVVACLVLAVLVLVVVVLVR